MVGLTGILDIASPADELRKSKAEYLYSSRIHSNRDDEMAHSRADECERSLNTAEGQRRSELGIRG